MIEDEEVDSFVADGVHVLKKAVIKFCSIKLSANLRFPCVVWACIKNLDHKIVECKNKIPLTEKIAHFDEEVIFQTTLAYNTQLEEFAKKELFIIILLESKSQPGSQKMVGRVRIDVASICNKQAYRQPTETKMEYCSVADAEYTFSFELLKIQHNLDCKDNSVVQQEPTNPSQEGSQHKDSKAGSPKRLIQIDTIEERPYSESQSVFSKQSPKFNPNGELFDPTLPAKQSNNQTIKEGQNKVEQIEDALETPIYSSKQKQVEYVEAKPFLHTKEIENKLEEEKTKKSSKNQQTQQDIYQKQTPTKTDSLPPVIPSKLLKSNPASENKPSDIPAAISHRGNTPQIMQRIRLAVFFLILGFLCFAYLLAIRK